MIPTTYNETFSADRMLALQWYGYLMVDNIINKGYATGEKLLDASEREMAHNIIKGHSFSNMEIEGAVLYTFALMQDAGKQLAVTPDNLERYFKDLKEGKV